MPFDLKNQHHENEKMLVRRAKEGDLKAFGRLVQRHQRQITALSMSLLRNQAETEEAVQETFFIAFRKLSGFREESRFSTWIYRVAMNHCLMRLRKKRPLAVGHINELEERMISAGSQNPPLWARSQTELLRQKAYVHALDDAFQRMGAAERAVLWLRVVDACTYQEIAKTLDLTMAASKSRLHRARMRFRECFERRLSEERFS